MKKSFLVTVFVCIILLVALFFAMPRNLADAVGVDDARVYIYCRSYSGEAIDIGTGVIAQCNMYNLQEALSKAHCVDGLSVHFAGGAADVCRLSNKLNLHEYFRETVQNLIVIYGYSPAVTGGIFVDGMYINVQIAYDGQSVNIGSPLILGSY
ncbi:MAG: hypothetical protein NC350_05750 [Corallococcus sp.]|nr:hypothetical protein [Corallococcus sp.]